jgi:hypothetical protein
MTLWVWIVEAAETEADDGVLEEADAGVDCNRMTIVGRRIPRTRAAVRIETKTDQMKRIFWKRIK